MIDIIIPTYNSGSTLIECLESIVKQDYLGSINVTIVNDGGCRDYDLSGIDLNIQELSYIENKGPGYARNYALERTLAPYITFIDADDTFTEDAISSLMTNIKDNDILVGLENMYDKEGSFVSTHSLTNIHGKLYKRSVIEKYNIRFPDFVYSAEDTAFNWLYQCFTNPYLSALNKVVYNYSYNCNKDSVVVKREDFYYSSNLKDLVQVGIWFLKELERRQVDTNKINSWIHKLTTEFSMYYSTDPQALEALKDFYSYLRLDKEDIVEAIRSSCMLDEDSTKDLRQLVEDLTLPQKYSIIGKKE